MQDKSIAECILNNNGFISEKTILFRGFRGGPTFSRGGGGGGGGKGGGPIANFHIETHIITCDFPGVGSGPSIPLWIRAWPGFTVNLSRVQKSSMGSRVEERRRYEV